MARVGRERVVMLLENNRYPEDTRPRREAESLANAGYDVLVIAPRARGQARRETVRGVHVERYTQPKASASVASFLVEYAVANVQLHLRGIRELIKGADVLHLHNPPDTLFPLASLARALGRRVVYDQHDLAPELMQVKFGDSTLVRLLMFMERMTFRFASLVLVPNESHRDIALARGGVAPERVFVVRNGPPVSTLVASANGRQDRLREPRLLFLGSMESQDGIDALPTVLGELVTRHGLMARLTMIGEGSCQDEVASAFARAGLSNMVTFTGRVEPGDVPALLAEADVCLDPADGNSLNHCSTMVKIAEYMAAGKPVVAHRLMETERTAGQAALYARCGDPLEFASQIAVLAADPQLRKRLGSLGLERVRDLTWERSEAALLEAYASL